MFIKRNKGYTMDKERRTTLFIEFMWGVLKWGLVGFLLITHSGCTSTRPRYPLEDQRMIQHSYDEILELRHFDTATKYCQVHYKWEVITALYDTKKDGYDYMVVKHRREK